MVHATEHEPATQHDETGQTIDETTHSWGLPAAGSTIFDFEYTSGRDSLLRLYDKGTRRAVGRRPTGIDWDVDVNFENPLGVPDESVIAVGTTFWEKMNERERGEVRRHQVAWQFSQFMHGEQGALMCASKIVNTVPTLDAKYYAATQVIDEARHVEVFGRYLHEKLRPGVSAEQQPAIAAQRRAHRQPLGHDLSRDAGAHRGARARGVRLDPQQRHRPARPARSMRTSCRTKPGT